MFRTLFAAAVLLAALHAAPAASQTLTFTPETTSGNGTVTPRFTWSTSPAASSCTASQGWAGQKGASGSETLPPIVKGQIYRLSCAWLRDSAVVSWDAPTKNTDLSNLTDLSGYRVTYGTNPANLSQVAVVASPSQTSVTLQPLTAGTWHFQVAAVAGARVSELTPVPPVSVQVGSLSKVEEITISVNPLPLPPSNVQVR
jgi:hypothetical protein